MHYRWPFKGPKASMQQHSTMLIWRRSLTPITLKSLKVEGLSFLQPNPIVKHSSTSCFRPWCDTKLTLLTLVYPSQSITKQSTSLKRRLRTQNQSFRGYFFVNLRVSIWSCLRCFLFKYRCMRTDTRCSSYRYASSSFLVEGQTSTFEYSPYSELGWLCGRGGHWKVGGSNISSQW